MFNLIIFVIFLYLIYKIGYIIGSRGIDNTIESIKDKICYYLDKLKKDKE